MEASNFLAVTQFCFKSTAYDGGWYLGNFLFICVNWGIIFYHDILSFVVPCNLLGILFTFGYNWHDWDPCLCCSLLMSSGRHKYIASLNTFFLTTFYRSTQLYLITLCWWVFVAITHQVNTNGPWRLYFSVSVGFDTRTIPPGLLGPLPSCK